MHGVVYSLYCTVYDCPKGLRVEGIPILYKFIHSVEDVIVVLKNPQMLCILCLKLYSFLHYY